MNTHSHSVSRIFLRFNKFAGAFSAVGLLLLFAVVIPAAQAQKPVSIPEQIEWTWEVRPLHPNPKLPNVLLLGDSITRNYYPEVKKDLAGQANVYLMATSICVDDPRLPIEIAEFNRMENVHFAVVHFNNGMHGWAYTEAQYREGFPGYLHSVRALVDRHGALIWANTTPVKPHANAGGATNARIDARNAIAKSFVLAAGIPVDNQHDLMMNHQNLHEDPVHFNPKGAAIQGDQVAATIRTALHKIGYSQ